MHTIVEFCTYHSGAEVADAFMKGVEASHLKKTQEKQAKTAKGIARAVGGVHLLS